MIKAKRIYTCSLCHKSGHNSRTCKTVKKSRRPAARKSRVKKSRVKKSRVKKSRKSRKSRKPIVKSDLSAKLQTLSDESFNEMLDSMGLSFLIGRNKSEIIKRLSKALYSHPKLKTLAKSKRYVLKKGTTLYHGSPYDITKFDQKAYFSFDKHTALAIMLLGRIKWTGNSTAEDFYFYTFKTTHDVVIDEHDIALYAWAYVRGSLSGKAFDLVGPGGIPYKDYCKSGNGWITNRESTPLPVRYKYLIDHPKILDKNIKGLSSSRVAKRKKCFRKIMKKHISDWSISWRERTKSLELVICKPDKHLKLVSKKKINGNKFVIFNAEQLLDIFYEMKYDPGDYRLAILRWKTALDSYL